MGNGWGIIENNSEYSTSNFTCCVQFLIFERSLNYVWHSAECGLCMCWIFYSKFVLCNKIDWFVWTYEFAFVIVLLQWQARLHKLVQQLAKVEARTTNRTTPEPTPSDACRPPRHSPACARSSTSWLALKSEPTPQTPCHLPKLQQRTACAVRLPICSYLHGLLTPNLHPASPLDLAPLRRLALRLRPRTNNPVLLPPSESLVCNRRLVPPCALKLATDPTDPAPPDLFLRCTMAAALRLLLVSVLLLLLLLPNKAVLAMFPLAAAALLLIWNVKLLTMPVNNYLLLALAWLSDNANKTSLCNWPIKPLLLALLTMQYVYLFLHHFPIVTFYFL